VVRPLPAEVREGYLAPYDSYDHRRAVLRFVQDIPLQPKDPSYAVVSAVQEGLHRFRQTPMLVCWGMRDFVFDLHFLNEWVRRFPQAEVHRFDHAGHYVLEDAGDQVLALVRHFLEAHPLAPKP
jgi:haloalkane dehalogenase